MAAADGAEAVQRGTWRTTLGRGLDELAPYIAAASDALHRLREPAAAAGAPVGAAPVEPARENALFLAQESLHAALLAVHDDDARTRRLCDIVALAFGRLTNTLVSEVAASAVQHGIQFILEVACGGAARLLQVRRECARDGATVGARPRCAVPLLGAAECGVVRCLRTASSAIEAQRCVGLRSATRQRALARRVGNERVSARAGRRRRATPSGPTVRLPGRRQHARGAPGCAAVRRMARAASRAISGAGFRRAAPVLAHWRRTAQRGAYSRSARRRRCGDD